MSKLLLKGHNGARFELNVVQFRSPMSASINSVQVRKMAHHFPIRAGQPDINFTAHFSSIDAKHEFQNFVREHQRNAQIAATTTDGGLVTLNWPERDIVGWTGYIVSMPIREARFEYAPRVTFGVALVESLMSERTTGASLGNTWLSILGPQIPAYVPYNPDTDLLQPPTQPSSQQVQDTQGQTQSVVESIFGAIGGIFR